MIKLLQDYLNKLIHHLSNILVYYTDKFLEDISKLGIRNYTKANIHKVTDNTDSMEQMVLDLIEKGFAYKTPDGSVYFDSNKIVNNPFTI